MRQSKDQRMTPTKAVLALAVASASFALPSAARAQPGWETIGSRAVNGGLDRDVIAVRGNERFGAIRLCASRRPVRLIDVDVDYANGTRQDMQAAALLSPGECTPPLNLNGKRRNITHVRLAYAKFRLFSKPPILTVQAR
jgi:hypothetical protein